MNIREEQCNKVCRILDDVLANRTTERDSLIVAVRKAFESLEQFGNSEPLPSAQPDIVYCKDCKHWDGEKRGQFWYFEQCSLNQHIASCDDFCSFAERM